MAHLLRNGEAMPAGQVLVSKATELFQDAFDGKGAVAAAVRDALDAACGALGTRHTPAMAKTVSDVVVQSAMLASLDDAAGAASAASATKAVYAPAAAAATDATTHAQAQTQTHREWLLNTTMRARAPVYIVDNVGAGDCLFLSIAFSYLAACVIKGETDAASHEDLAELLTPTSAAARQVAARIRHEACSWFAHDEDEAVQYIGDAHVGSTGNVKTRIQLVLDYECASDDQRVVATDAAKRDGMQFAIEATHKEFPDVGRIYYVNQKKAPPAAEADAVARARRRFAWRKYVRTMAWKGTWGSGPEIIAAASVYGIAVEVYEVDADTRRLRFVVGSEVPVRGDVDYRALMASEHTFPPPLKTRGTWTTLRLLRDRSHYTSLLSDAEFAALTAALWLAGHPANPMGAVAFEQPEWETDSEPDAKRARTC